jgi:hypothetical protein
MIRKFPGHDVDNPPGCVNYDKPFVQAVEDYVSESHQKALQEAYQRGWWDGYAKCEDEHLEASRALDPSSENAR